MPNVFLSHAGRLCAAIDSFELKWLQVKTLRKQPLGPGQQSAATDASPDLPPLPTDFPPLPDIKPAPIDEVCSTAYIWCIQRSLQGRQTPLKRPSSAPMCALCSGGSLEGLMPSSPHLCRHVLLVMVKGLRVSGHTPL